jgi:uncharacterized protein (TIGR03905 family)
MYEYKTKGTCATAIHFGIKDGKVHSVSFDGGCDGNLKALSILAEGMQTEELIQKLKGLTCRKKQTSCGDQFARALEQYRPAAGAEK